MATFIKGEGVPHAKGYVLYYDGGGTNYAGIKPVGNVPFGYEGERIASNGTIETTELSIAHTDMYDVADFDETDYTNPCVCLYAPNGDALEQVLFLYGEKDNFSSFIRSYAFEELNDLTEDTLSGGHIVELAKSNNANYVAFCSDTSANQPEVILPNKICFRLDDHPFEVGEHTLYVEAIGEGGEDTDGDGIIYEGSDRSNEVTYTVVNAS